MAISVLKSGVLDTIQDDGRCGFSDLGVNISGAMDRYAMKVANMLVTNEVNRPVIEMHFPAPQILFEQNALISITGGDFSPTVNGEQVAMWKPLLVRKNSVLQFSHKNKGARCYLAVHGGFAIEKWLNSYSTNLKAMAGGWHGRKLEKGDEIHFEEADFYFAGLFEKEGILQLPWSVDSANVYQYPYEIAMIPGKEWCLLTEDVQQKLLQDNFVIHPSSDRMGFHLRGPFIIPKKEYQLVSSAVSFGTIQLLPDNQLIILMADHQTTGGYPRIGHVIAAHLPKLAQLGASDSFKFKIANIESAEKMFFAQQRELQMIQSGCSEKMKQALCTA